MAAYIKKSSIYPILFSLMNSNLNPDEYKEVSLIIEDLMNTQGDPQGESANTLIEYFSSLNEKTLNFCKILMKKPFYKVLNSSSEEDPNEIIISMSSFITHLLIQGRSESIVLAYFLKFIDIKEINDLISKFMVKPESCNKNDLIKESNYIIDVVVKSDFSIISLLSEMNEVNK